MRTSKFGTNRIKYRRTIRHQPIFNSAFLNGVGFYLEKFESIKDCVRHIWRITS